MLSINILMVHKKVPYNDQTVIDKIFSMPHTCFQNSQMCEMQCVFLFLIESVN